MILPHSQGSLILLMVICVLCWGCWPILFKLAKRYRFELFYFDFAIGLSFVALIAAFTLGSLGYDGFRFTDDMLNARKQEWLYAFLGAIIFNFGNMLTLGAASVAGVSVAFPMSFGVAMIVAAWMDYLGKPGADMMLMAGGTLLVVISVIMSSSGYSHWKVLQHERLARAGNAKSTRRPSAIKGILIALIGGLILGTFGPMLQRAQNPEDGVGPYALMFLFGAGVAFSTFAFNLFFMNLPIEGDPLEIIDFLRVPIKNHVLGLSAGILWAVGSICALVSASPKGDTHLSGGLYSILALSGPALAGLLALFGMKEMRDGGTRVKAFAGVAILLFVLGVLAFSYAPVASAKP